MRRGSPAALALLAAYAGWSAVAVELAGRRLQATAVIAGLLSYFALELWRTRRRRLPWWTAFRPPIWFDQRAYVALIAAPIFAEAIVHFDVGWLGVAFAFELAFVELVGRVRTR